MARGVRKKIPIRRNHVVGVLEFEGKSTKLTAKVRTRLVTEAVIIEKSWTNDISCCVWSCIQYCLLKIQVVSLRQIDHVLAR